MITLICGVGCAGKTTYSQQFDNVIHLDDAGLPRDRYNKVNEIVSKISGDVVIDGIYSHADRRKRLLESYSGDGVCIWINVPEATVREHAKKRHVPISRRHMHFEPPTMAEGWNEIIEVTEV